MENIGMTARDMLEMILVAISELVFKKAALDTFVIANRYQSWYDLTNYAGLPVGDRNRTDN